MVANNLLAGNCYALHKRFINNIQEQQVRIPVGLIGEDFFVSWLVSVNMWRQKHLEDEWLRCAFCGVAEFAFRSLSPLRVSDYKTYVRRKWRYALRDIQYRMLMQYLANGAREIPTHVDQLYTLCPLPRRFVWIGLDTIMRSLVVQWLRKVRKQLLITVT